MMNTYRWRGGAVMAEEGDAAAAQNDQSSPALPLVFTLERFRLVEAALRADDYGPEIEWSENIPAPRTCRHFANEAVYVIAASGMRVTTAKAIHRRCMRALREGELAGSVFGHPGKSQAMDRIWRDRRSLFKLWRHISDDDERIIFLAELPFVGGITKYHLAKNLGVNVVKPDVHMDRLANAEGSSPWDLCHRLAKQTGYREATIDTILWAGCAYGVLDSSAIETKGWEAGYRASKLGQNPAIPPNQPKEGEPP
jgi:hypothetical protein